MSSRHPRAWRFRSVQASFFLIVVFAMAAFGCLDSSDTQKSSKSSAAKNSGRSTQSASAAHSAHGAPTKPSSAPQPSPAPQVPKRYETGPYTVDLDVADRQRAALSMAWETKKGSESPIYETWLPPQYVAEDESGSTCTAMLIPRGKARILAAGKERVSIHRFDLAFVNPGAAQMQPSGIEFRLVRQTHEMGATVHTRLEIRNNGKTPLILRKQHIYLAPTMIYAEGYGLDKAQVFFPTGESQPLELPKEPGKFAGVFDGPVGLRFRASGNSHEILLDSQGISDHAVQMSRLPGKVIIELVPDRFLANLTVGDGANAAKIRPFLTPGETFVHSFSCRLGPPPANRPAGMACLGWYPAGRQAAFALQADEIKPDHGAPQIAKRTYKNLEDFYFKKVHSALPQMKMQTILVVDDFNPYYSTPAPLAESPYAEGLNDLRKNPEDVALYQRWLNEYGDFFSIQSHAVHHAPANLPGGRNYMNQWEFNTTSSQGSGAFTSDRQWVWSMVQRIRTEIEEAGLGPQRYFKAAGYSRCYPLAQALAEQGYRIWDFNPNISPGSEDLFHARVRYCAPGGESLWIIGSGVSISPSSSIFAHELYTTATERTLRRGFPVITSGHIENLSDPAHQDFLVETWRSLYAKFCIWNAFPAEMADYWEQRYFMEMEQTNHLDSVQVRVVNRGRTEVKGATVLWVPFESPPRLPKGAKVDGCDCVNFWISGTNAAAWANIPPGGQTIFEFIF